MTRAPGDAAKSFLHLIKADKSEDPTRPPEALISRFSPGGYRAELELRCEVGPVLIQGDTLE